MGVFVHASQSLLTLIGGFESPNAARNLLWLFVLLKCVESHRLPAKQTKQPVRVRHEFMINQAKTGRKDQIVVTPLRHE